MEDGSQLGGPGDRWGWLGTTGDGGGPLGMAGDRGGHWGSLGIAGDRRGLSEIGTQPVLNYVPVCKSVTLLVGPCLGVNCGG